MKKQILLALPLATGLFAVSGAANAGDDPCRTSSGRAFKPDECFTIVVDDAYASNIEINRLTTIYGKDSVRMKGQIMTDIKYEITRELGVLSESKSGWRKELNLVSWNGDAPKYNLRDWAPGHAKMGKGVTLTEEELRKLKDILNA